VTTIRYFSLGRFAMKQALVACGVDENDSVMLPSFICRDVLAAINELGAKATFYDVNKKLEPIGLDSAPTSKAIIAVNYFGFPQSLEPFKKYCINSGAKIIEDNAHGFLSRDSENQLLGQRTEYGSTSFRKSVRTSDGAMLTTSHNDTEIAPQVAFQNSAVSFRNIALSLFAKIERSTNVPVLKLTQSAVKKVRQMKTGSAMPKTDSSVEKVIPGMPNPNRSSVTKILAVNETKEVARRRILYNEILPDIVKLGLQPVFSTLESGTSPYGFPVYAAHDSQKQLAKLARKHRVTLMSWPDLPIAVLPTAPEYYKQIWLLNFL
jgi:hypothetical protein